MRDKNSEQKINNSTTSSPENDLNGSGRISNEAGSEVIPKHDQTLDARGLACPMPLLKTKLALNTLAAGQYLKVFASDKGSVRDFHAYAELSGHEIIRFEDLGSEFHYLIKKAEC